MSEPCPHVASQALARTRWSFALLLAVLVEACSSGESDASADGSFGRGVNEYPRDAGMDASARMDASAAGDLPNVRVRFVHALVNLGPLAVCHDPDGTGPEPARLVSTTDGGALRASFRERSAEVSLTPLLSGSLTLQRTGVDAGRDGGAPDPCAASEREATIPLPQEGSWLDPRAPLDDAEIDALELSKTVSGAASLTLVGTGFALDQTVLALRASRARDAALAAAPDDRAGADAAADLERRTLEAAFGPRVSIQRDPTSASASTFSLSVLHAIPDVPTADEPASTTVGAVRLCITAGARESNAVPRAPLPGVPFRYRTTVGNSFESGLEYHFRAFAQRDFELDNKDCSTIGSLPIAERRFSAAALRAGHAYTLALVGAIAPTTLCSPGDASLVRAGCALTATELAARIELFED